MANLDKEGIEFLNRLYKDMYKSDEVMHGIDERFIGNKTDNIGHYIDRMQELHERVETSGRENDLRMLKEFYYRKYVIKENDIPDSYYEHQKEIYLERGYGHVEFNEKDKHEMTLQIISEQKKRLDIWIEYFVSNDSSYIPMWAKYWAFQGMLSLGNYDKKNKTFGKRSKGTISPFIDLNREALSLSIDFLLKTLRKEEIDDKKLEVLVQGGSFGKIYSYILTNVLSKNNSSKKSTDGKWVKYSQGSDHMPLVKSLQGYNTGWCIAGEAIAKSQLKIGDFYVYYTYDENGNAVVPRIAIRMEKKRIAEVRGVAEDQNIEAEMEEVVEQKLNEFPDKDRYKKKVSDMKSLTLIYRKFKSNENLTNEELRFLYELDEKIEGFGYDRDPRIDEIIGNRNRVMDLNSIFKDILVYNGNLSLNNLRESDYLCFPKIFNGNLEFKYLSSGSILTLPQIINGNLFFYKLLSIDNLVLPKVINGSLRINGLESIQNLKLPTMIGGHLEFKNLIEANELVLPTELNGYLDLRSLRTANGIKFPKLVKGYLKLQSLTKEKILELPEIIKGELSLNNLVSFEKLSLPKVLYGNLRLNSLKNTKDLILPEEVKGKIFLNSLDNLNGVILPKQFEEIILANGVVVTPDNIHEYIDKPKSK